MPHTSAVKAKKNKPLGNWSILLLGSSLAELVDGDVLVVVVCVWNWCGLTLTDDDCSVGDEPDTTFTINSQSQQLLIHFSFSCSVPDLQPANLEQVDNLLYAKAMRGLSHLRAPHIVPCVTSFSEQLPWCDHSRLVSLLWQCLTVICFPCCPWIPQNLSQSFHLKGTKTYYSHY